MIDIERVTISCNNIHDNTNYGVKVDTTDVTETINAENNWWGDASDPSGVGSGSGDAVTSNVDYDPWLGDVWQRSSPCVPPPVGDLWTVINRFELLSPWIGLASLMAVATISIVYVKRRKKKQT